MKERVFFLVLMDKIEACEMWFLRHMGKTSWKQKMKNEHVLKNLKTEKTLPNTIKARKLNFQLHQTPQLNYEKHLRRQDGGQKTMRQASGSVLRQHQGVVRAQLSRMYEIDESERGVALDF